MAGEKMSLPTWILPWMKLPLAKTVPPPVGRMVAVRVSRRLSKVPVEVTTAGWVGSSAKLPVPSPSATETVTVPSPMAMLLSQLPGVHGFAPVGFVADEPVAHIDAGLGEAAALAGVAFVARCRWRCPGRRGSRR